MEQKILDQGYIKLIEHWGSDERIVEAARMSVDKGFVSWEPYEGHPRGDFGLLSHLWHNKHATPFEMAGMIIEVKAPIFVFREWHRHRTQSYNEMSARYIPLPDENYWPDLNDLMTRGNMQSSNKQAQGSGNLSLHNACEWRERLYRAYLAAQDAYEFGIEAGVPKELARLSVPVARYSAMRASANLRNWLAFLTLRNHPTAQKEIRVYAEAVSNMIEDLFPKTHSLFMGVK